MQGGVSASGAGTAELRVYELASAEQLKRCTQYDITNTRHCQRFQHYSIPQHYSTTLRWQDDIESSLKAFSLPRQASKTATMWHPASRITKDGLLFSIYQICLIMSQCLCCCCRRPARRRQCGSRHRESPRRTRPTTRARWTGSWISACCCCSSRQASFVAHQKHPFELAWAMRPLDRKLDQRLLRLLKSPGASVCTSAAPSEVSNLLTTRVSNLQAARACATCPPWSTAPTERVWDCHFLAGFPLDLLV